MSTDMFAAKRAIFDALSLLKEPGGPWENRVQVSYSWRSGLGPIVVYGGGITFDQPGEDDLTDGTDVLYAERSAVAVHVRVTIPLDELPGDDPIRAADAQAEQIGWDIGRMLLTNPYLCGKNTTATLRSGRADYLPNEGKADSTLSYRIEVTSFVDYREE